MPSHGLLTGTGRATPSDATGDGSHGGFPDCCRIFSSTEEYLPIYDVKAVAEALDIDLRQLDNLLSRNTIHGVDRSRRGVTRRVSSEAAVIIALSRELTESLGVPSAQALRLASALERDDSGGLAIGPFGWLRFDLVALRAFTLERLDAAVETVGRRRRGRPARAATAATAFE